MKLKKSMVVLSLALSLCLGMVSVTGATASSANRSAGKAFAAALSKGEIAYDKNSTFSIGDMDGDGVKDLLINRKSTSKIYAYKSGTVKKILKYTPEYELAYDPDKKVIWESGEGDGSWHIAQKLEDGSLTELYRYFCEYDSNDKLNYYYQKAGGSKKKITEEKYRDIAGEVSKCSKTLSKNKLIKKLKKLN